MRFVTRFAPSPTGALHLGHAFSALTAHDAARAAGGVFLVRIEDLDQGRCKPEFEAAILADLTWLGIRWDAPVRRQSQHMGRYGAALESLRARGLVYRCFRTRRDLMLEAANAPHGRGDALRPGPLSSEQEAQRLAAGEPFAWRLAMAASCAAVGEDRLRLVADGVEAEADPGGFGDVVLGRKDAPASYHLASVLDDADQGVTVVIRGEDLAEAAHLHRLLQALLGLPAPTYRHHRLILGADGKRLAKRDKAMSLQALREAGAAPQDVRALVGLAPSPP